MPKIQALEGNWEQIYVYQKIAEEVPNYPLVEKYFPIPEWDSLLLIDSPVVAIHATSSTAGEHWKFAGQALQRIRTGLAVGGNPDTVYGVKKFWLNQTSLLWFDLPVGEYQLSFKVPYWIREIDITGWVYSGPITQTYDQILAEIQGAVTP